MAEPKTTTYRARVSGLLNTRHTLSGPDGELGVLNVHRNRWGRIDRGSWKPLKGEVLEFRRQPGILRSQFMVWTEGKEWLGASLRWSFLRRAIEVSTPTGAKPFRLLPLPGLRRGWRVLAPRSGEVARIEAGLLGRDAEIVVTRRIDFELLLFTYFLGSQLLRETLWPGPALDATPDSIAAAKA